ncbi:MAG: hypothetical protein M3P18_00680 [Actinomycetota bacterium]|nr:hypothetical protein [Actinomycetota bacterium]
MAPVIAAAKFVVRHRTAGCRPSWALGEAWLRIFQLLFIAGSVFAGGMLVSFPEGSMRAVGFAGDDPLVIRLAGATGLGFGIALLASLGAPAPRLRIP